jgi:hypothetical protein
VILILVLTGFAVSLCLAAIFLLLGEKGNPAPLPLVLAIASVLLGWFTVHTVAAFRYAHLYYTPETSAKAGYAQGLDFPGEDEPHMSDFLYYSFGDRDDVAGLGCAHAVTPDPPHHARTQRHLLLLQHRDPGAGGQHRGRVRGLASRIWTPPTS